MDSAKQNLASSFVNGFVNAAFGKDKLLTEDGNKWIYKHNDHGRPILSAGTNPLQANLQLKKLSKKHSELIFTRILIIICACQVLFVVMTYLGTTHSCSMALEFAT